MYNFSSPSHGNEWWYNSNLCMCINMRPNDFPWKTALERKGTKKSFNRWFYVWNLINRHRCWSVQTYTNLSRNNMTRKMGQWLEIRAHCNCTCWSNSSKCFILFSIFMVIRWRFRAQNHRRTWTIIFLIS